MIQIRLRNSSKVKIRKIVLNKSEFKKLESLS